MSTSGGSAGGEATLAAIVDDTRDTSALLCLVDTPPEGAATDGDHYPDGLTANIDGSGDVVSSNLRGGALTIGTGGTGDSQGLLMSPAAMAYADRNPHLSFVLTSRAAIAALKVQGWGMIDGTATSTFYSTTTHKAMFRSVTTGNLFAVTGNGSSEETTDLGSFHTLGTAGVFEVFTTDDGTTWKFEIAGTERASHTTQVPTITQDQRVVCGIENNTTTDLQITQVDLIAGVQDRT